MEAKTVSARMEINSYANKILGIIKIKYGLKDKSEALNKFIEMYGDEVLDKEATEEYTQKVIETTKNHYNLHKNKKMSVKELDNLFEV